VPIKQLLRSPAIHRMFFFFIESEYRYSDAAARRSDGAYKICVKDSSSSKPAHVCFRGFADAPLRSLIPILRDVSLHDFETAVVFKRSV